MRIRIEENIESVTGPTTFDIHLIDLSPKEYSELREMMNRWLENRVRPREDPLGRPGN